MAHRRILFDLGDRRSVTAFSPINDVVMGGVSTCSLSPTEAGTAVFTGVVRPENGGGFASIRSEIREGELAGHGGIALRVRGDGKRYKLNLRGNAALGNRMYRSPFETESGRWQTVRLPFSSFEASSRGKVIPDAPPLDLAHICAIGVLISDKQFGPFRLEIEWIGAD